MRDFHRTAKEVHQKIEVLGVVNVQRSTLKEPFGERIGSGWT